MAAILAIALKPWPRLATTLGTALCVWDAVFRETEGFHFLITAGVDQFTAVNPLQIIWGALVTSGVVSLLPTWKPLEAVGRHGFTLNLVAAVVATWVRFYLSDVHTNIRLARVRDSPAPNIRSAG